MWKFFGSGEYPPYGRPKVAELRIIGCTLLGNLYAPLQFAIPGKEELLKMNIEAVCTNVGGYFDL